MSRVQLLVLAMLLLFASRSPACTPPPPEDAITTVQQLDLIRAFLLTPSGWELNHVQVGDYSVDHDVRHGLRVKGIARVFSPPVRLTPGSEFQVEIGVPDELWNESGDGVEFTVFARQSNDAVSKLYSRYLDPKHQEADRRWVNVRIPLHQLAGSEIRIELTTGRGPDGDERHDAGIWARPIVQVPVAP